ncbi:MAG: hypothetical protein IH856_16740 [Deltaproteobacteria bacterium]|nr:hypothetical protein [Deltaproteobacteria bacterium]
MKAPSEVGSSITRKPRGKQILARTVIVGLAAFCLSVATSPIYGQQVPLDSKTLARHLAAIEERNPYRLRGLVRNGRPTLIAFIDHLCYTCLRSVGPLEQLRREFSGRANVIVIDPSRISVAHTWAKDRYRVWFVPKFVIVDKGGDIASEYFGPTPSRTLASDLQPLLAR